MRPDYHLTGGTITGGRSLRAKKYDELQQRVALWKDKGSVQTQAIVESLFAITYYKTGEIELARELFESAKILVGSLPTGIVTYSNDQIIALLLMRELEELFSDTSASSGNEKKTKPGN